MENIRCNVILLPLCLVFLSVCSLQAQEDSWQEMKGPTGNGGRISQMITGNNGCVCAATDFGGLYVSNDNGDHWTERVSELILCLAVNKDGKLFAGGINGGLYTSTDDGMNWTSISPPEFSGYWISGIAIDSSDRIYLCGNIGFLRSDDNGQSWIEINSGIGNDTPRELTAGPQGVVFAGFYDGIYRTTDYGAHWSPMNEGLTFSPADMRTIVISKSGYVLASVYGGGVFRSTIKGYSWEKVLDDFSFSLAIDSSGHIYNGSMGTGIYRSDDEGLTWVPVNTGLGNLEVRSLAANSEGNIFAGTNGMGVFRSSNLGLSWEETNSGLDNMSIDFITGNSKNEIFVGSQGGGIQKSSDDGTTWTRIAQDLDPMIYSIKIDPSDRIFISNREGAFMSRDNGENWESIFSNGLYYLNFAFSKNERIVAAGACSNGIWISDETGGNWTYSSSVVFPDFLNDVVINESNYIFAASYINGLYISKNFGASWDQIMINATYHDVYKLFLNNNGSLFASAFETTDMGCKVFRSDDNGATWTAASNGLTNSQVLSFTADSSGCIYLGSMGAGVYRSSDNGQTWTTFNDGLKRKYISSVYFDRNGYLWAGSAGGDNFKKSAVEGNNMNSGLKSGYLNSGSMSNSNTGSYLFRIKIASASTAVISSMESKDITLEQNFPNPFSLNSTIRYNLAQPENISLKVYNSLGQLIAILMNELQNAGTHEVSLCGKELPAGVYFYRLQTQKAVLEKKFIISK
jgi:photosystem II stability/assembly factor-like uncharacterized protein